ncbi:Kelch repeat-containing protein [Deinococcus sonorensis]|uniref:Kelch repeat-containing protein n=2 Tax=Deinococcus sonorensis TaxID=309891 RepID=A0AAU7U7P1_9DEIO
MTNRHAVLPLRRLWLAGALLLTLGACAEPSTPPPGSGSGPTPPGPLAWKTAAPAPISQYEAAGASIDGRLYVFGGFYTLLNNKPLVTVRTSVYNSASGRWNQLADMPEAVTHAATVAVGSKVYLAGGFIGDHPGPETDHVWIYDTATNRWSAGPSLPAPRGAGALALVGRKLHFFGGTRRDATELHDYTQDFGTHWVLDLDGSGDWTEAAPLPTPRNHLSGIALDGLIYAIGGQHLGDEVAGDLPDVQVYDPATDRWSARKNLPLPLGHTMASTVVWNGHIVVAGGVTLAENPAPDDVEGKESNTVLDYDPKTDKWTRLTDLPAPRQSPVAGVLGTKLVVTGGATDDGPTDVTWIGTR